MKDQAVDVDEEAVDWRRDDEDNAGPKSGGDGEHDARVHQTHRLHSSANNDSATGNNASSFEPKLTAPSIAWSECDDSPGHQKLRVAAQKSKRLLLQIDAEEDEADSHHHDYKGHHHDHLHDQVMPWYNPPIQRVRWDEEQSLPHVNWGDLFFDLFYVAAAYNFGSMLTTAMNSTHATRGLIYFIGTFGPLWRSWETSMLYESRYTSIDYAHRIFEIIRYLFVSTAIIHVKTVDQFMDPKNSETLFFVCAMLGETLMHLMLNIEIYVRGQGDLDCIRHHTKSYIIYELVPIIMVYLGAVATSAVLFIQSDDAEHDEGYHRFLGEAQNKTDVQDDYYSTPKWQLSDLPLTLTAAAYILNIAISTVRKFLARKGKKNGTIKKTYVPNNVDYVIHRYGEWTLLMIGEGILSLCIVDTADVREYYIITTFGVLTIIFIQVLKFESEPSHGDGHAMWRNILNGMCYSYLIQVLSISLIIFGVSYKIFLKDIVKNAAKYESDNESHRLLGATPNISSEDAASVFAGALCVVLLCLEAIDLTHEGLQKSLMHFALEPKSGDRCCCMPNWPVVAICVVKYVVIIVLSNVPRWTTDPVELTVSGCWIVCMFAVTRVLNLKYRKKYVKSLHQPPAEKVTNNDEKVIYNEEHPKQALKEEVLNLRRRVAMLERSLEQSMDVGIKAQEQCQRMQAADSEKYSLEC